MFDAIGAFEKQFTPFQEGYLVYPSRKSGGKFITADEYERLVTDWKRVAGGAGIWKIVGVVFAAILLWTALGKVISLPEWAQNAFVGVVVAAISVFLFWTSMAPRRFVRNRRAVAPPRSATEARREARDALNWQVVVFGLGLSGAVFFSTVSASERDLTTWAWLVGSGLMFGLYLWIALKKATDRPH